MAANRKAKVAHLLSPWSDFNNFSVYSRVFNVSELIALVFKMILRQCHGLKVIRKVKFKKMSVCKGF